MEATRYQGYQRGEAHIMTHADWVVRGNSAALLAGGALLVLLASSAALAARAADAAQGKGEIKPVAPAPAKVELSESDDAIFNRLPKEWRKPDGSFDHDALVAHLKKRLEVISQALPTQLKVAETPHYLVASDADAGTTSLFVKWCEALYANLSVLFALQDSARVWDAKCLLLVIEQRARFDKFAVGMDSHRPNQPAAYFGVEEYGNDSPALVKICVCVEGKPLRDLQDLLAHEGTHAFFDLYRKRGGLPLWLHEGLAEYMASVNDRTLRGPIVAEASDAGRSGASIRHVFLAQREQGLAQEQSSIAMTLVDFLITSGKPKFKKFVDALKDGKNQEAALSAAYGFTLADLEKRWRIYVVQYLPKQK